MLDNGSQDDNAWVGSVKMAWFCAMRVGGCVY